MFKVVYLKLTFIYVLIIMVISISFSSIIHSISTKEIKRGLGPQSRIFQEQMPQNIENLRREQIEESANELRINLIYYNLIIFILSLFGCYYLARKTLAPIEQAMISQSHFTADASHELRTPLSAIKTEIEVALRDKKLGFNQTKKILKSNLEEIEKLINLSENLLALSKNEKDNLELKKINLEEIIIQAYSKVENLAKKKSIKFDNVLKKVVIKGDKSSLIQLFVILLDNAIKYSPNNSTIKINIAKIGHHVIVKIKDQGIGIKASDLPYIFNRFYRSDMSRSKLDTSGYGLGLAIAKQIVLLHRGLIWAKSRPGKGSEFFVKF